MIQRRTVLAAAAVLALAAPFAGNDARAQTPSEINFGIISTENSTALRSQWSPLLADLEKSVGVKINPFFATDYAGIVEAMRFNKVQIAWYGNAAAIQAVDRAEGEVFLQKVYLDGTKGYYSLLIVHKDSPIKSFDDLLHSPAKYTFGNGDPNSTSGFLMPSYYAWAKNNIDIRKHFTRIVIGSHEVNAVSVANKQVDVATNNTEDFEKYQKAQPEKAAQIREIWRSPLIPSDPLVWRKDLPDALKTKVKAFFLDYGSGKASGDAAKEKATLAGLGGWGRFDASSNDQLIPVRQIALFRDKLKIEQDDKMAADEKAKKVAEIDSALAELNRKLEAAPKTN